MNREKKAEQGTKLQRWLDEIAYLALRRLPVSVDELMGAVPAFASRWNSGEQRQRDSARRMWERDKDELRTLGIPIRTLQYQSDDNPAAEGYIIERRDFYLPYLKIVKELSATRPYSEPARHDTVEIAEADAPLALQALRRVTQVPGFPLAQEAKSAFRKLAFDLDPGTFHTPDHVLWVDQPAAAELAGVLRLLSDALLARKRVGFTYQGVYRGEKTQRDVAGYGLLFQRGHWYFIGHDSLRDDVRVFRVGRMSDAEQNRAQPNTHDYEVPPDFHLEDYAGLEAWELGAEREEAPVVAHVRFRFPLSLWAERNEYGRLLSRDTEGGQVRAFDVHQVEPFVRWVLGMAGDAFIESPQELARELRDMARTIATSHGADTP